MNEWLNWELNDNVIKVTQVESFIIIIQNSCKEWLHGYHSEGNEKPQKVLRKNLGNGLWKIK
jgi:hypothetical protein